MRFAAWVLHLLACAAVLLAALALIEVRSAPSLVRELAASDDPVLLNVMTPRGLVVVRRSSAWLVRPSLEAQLLGWPDTVPGIAEVRSADFAHDELALVVRKLDGKMALLRADKDRVVQVPMHSAYDPVALHGGQVYFVATGEGVNAVCSSSWRETRVTYRYDCHRLDLVTPQTLRGLLFDGSGYLMAFGEPDRLAFVNEDEQPWSVPGVIHGPGFLPPGQLSSLYLDDSARGVLQLAERKVVLARDGSRVALDRGGRMEAIGTSRVPSGEFVAHRRRPDGWLVVSQSANEALLLDDKLVRVDEGRAPLALSGLSFGGWLAILVGLAAALLVAPIPWWRARRKLSGLDGANTFYGTLKIPSALEGEGRLGLPKGSLLVVKGIEYELSSGLRALDGGIPFVDGDSVCVVGTLERGGDGAFAGRGSASQLDTDLRPAHPFREGGPRRIVPDRGRYFVARGESNDWAARILAGADVRFLVAALGLLTVAAAVQRFLSRLI